MNHANSGEILVQEVRFPRSEIFLATLLEGYMIILQRYSIIGGDIE